CRRFGNRGRLDEQLGRQASDIEAGASEMPFLCNGRLQAGEPLVEEHVSRTGADQQQIVVRQSPFLQMSGAPAGRYRAEEAKGRHGCKPVTPSLYSTASVSRSRSERVVELELGRRRTQPGHVEFVLALDPDPRFDEIGGEDVSGGEEVVVLLEVVERLVEGAG